MSSKSPSFTDEPVRIRSGSLSLAAKSTIASPFAPVLILAHGFGGTMDEKGLFLGARDFFVRNGFSVLRFDFRGCGESEGDFRAVRLDDLAADLSNVIKYVRSGRNLKPSSIGLICFSLGAGIAILANSAHIGAHVFWSPAVYTDRDMSPRYQSEEIENQIARHGWFDKAGLQVSREFFGDLRSRHIEHSLPAFRHSVLVLHGRDDTRIPSTSSEELIRHLPRSSKLTIIPDADHSFRSQPHHREWLFSASTMWLRTRLWRQSPPHFGQAHLFRSEAGDSLPIPNLQ
jgi:pimeloyl-ACP methyl ester carboxylesterase